MRLRFVVGLALICALAAAAPAYALPHLSKTRTKHVTLLVDRFVKDVVMRQDLHDGWLIAGPHLRAGTTKRDFVTGRAVPVQYFKKLVGHSWRNGWYAKYVGHNEFDLDVPLKTGTPKNTTMYDMEVDVVRVHGKWVVDSFYPNAVIRLGKGHRGSCATSNCAITGINDFGAGSGSGSAYAHARLGSEWFLFLVGAIVAVPLTVLVVYIVRARREYRRAEKAYAEANRA
jgi:hypothetical protein